MRFSASNEGLVLVAIVSSLLMVTGCSSRHDTWIQEEPPLLPISQPIIVVSSHFQLDSLENNSDSSAARIHPASAEYEDSLRSKVEFLIGSKSKVEIKVIPQSEWLMLSGDDDSAETVKDSHGYPDMYHYARISGAKSVLSVRLAVIETDLPVSSPFFSLFGNDSKYEDSTIQNETLICQVGISGVVDHSVTRGLTLVNHNDSTNSGITELAKRIVENWPFATLNSSKAK